MLSKIIKIFKRPKLLLFYILASRLSRILPDKPFLKIEYRLRMRRRLELNNPKTFNEKLQWLKLYEREAAYTEMADKFRVRHYIKNVIGGKYLIPLLGVYNSYEEIDFSYLPDQFVLKPNHTSGDVFICKDKSGIDHAKLKQKVNRWLKNNYYWLHREWPYKNVKPRILCEEYLRNGIGGDLKDYKFMCFGGEPKIVRVLSEKKNNHYFVNHYNLEWEELDVPECNYERNTKKLTKPVNLSNMIEICKMLSKNRSYVRIDLYEAGSRIYFGEITFYHAGGYMDFARLSDDKLLGSWIDLPQ